MLRDIQLLEHRHRVECPVQDQTDEEQRREAGGEPEAVDDVAEGVAHGADRKRRKNSRYAGEEENDACSRPVFGLR